MPVACQSREVTEPQRDSNPVTPIKPYSFKCSQFQTDCERVSKVFLYPCAMFFKKQEVIQIEKQSAVLTNLPCCGIIIKIIMIRKEESP